MLQLDEKIENIALLSEIYKENLNVIHQIHSKFGIPQKGSNDASKGPDLVAQYVTEAVPYEEAQQTFSEIELIQALDAIEYLETQNKLID